MSDGLTDEEVMLVDTVRAFVDRDVKPEVRDIEHANTYPEAWIEQMKQLGIETGLTLIKNAPHGFIGKQAFFDPMIEQADAFLRETLK